MTTTLQNIETTIRRDSSRISSMAMALGAATYFMLSPASAVGQETERKPGAQDSNPDDCYFKRICEPDQEANSVDITQTPGTAYSPAAPKPVVKARPKGPSQLAQLANRVRALESADIDYKVQLQGVQNRLSQLQQGTPSAPAAASDQALLQRIDGLVSRLEGYEAFQKQTKAVTEDPALQYMLPIFRRGLQELKPSKDAMAKACINAIPSTPPHQTDRRAVAELERLDKVCQDATAEYEATKRDFALRVQNNIFSRDRKGDARRVWFELGAQYRHDGAHDGAVVGAITYRGDHATVGFGAGAGYGGESSTESHSTIRQDPVQSGRYQEVASELRSELTAQRYRGHLQLRLSTPDFPLGRRGRWAQWAVAGGLAADLLVSDQTVTNNRTRTSQLYRGEERVGEPHETSGSDTEQSTHYSLVPGIALELLRDADKDGYALGLRGTLGGNYSDNQLDATLMLLGRF